MSKQQLLIERCVCFLVFVEVISRSVAVGQGAPCLFHQDHSQTTPAVLQQRSNCDALAHCDAQYHCFPAATPCPNVGNLAYRKTENQWPLGTCTPTYQNRCYLCPPLYNFACSEVRAYVEDDDNGNCVDACPVTVYRTGNANGCRPPLVLT